MKFLSLATLFCFVALTCSCGTSATQDAIRDAVDRQLEEYPESRLQDLYKSFFQDRFGPGHIIKDRDWALEFILEELQEEPSMSGRYNEPCGWENNYVRINLKAVQDSLLSAEELLDAFIQSAEAVPDEKITEWKKEWNTILSVIERYHPDIPGLSKDKESLDSLLSLGLYATHHSNEYRNAYRPHYRIVRQELADSLLCRFAPTPTANQ